MKLQLTKDNENTIQGYKTIVYTDPNKISELNGIINNSCEYILANTILDDFEIEQHPNILGVLVSKLRLGGTIVIIGHDFNTISKAFLNHEMSIGEVSNLIKNKKSINTALNVIKSLSQIGLNISSIKYNQYLYEIVALRETQ